MIYTKQDIEEFDRVTRIKIINSVTGIKPANLIGSINDKGQTNLAVFSSLVHLGSDPALLGFIARPQTAEVGHTLRNIRENEVYTINHIQPEFIEKAHYTSAKFPAHISEFESCNLTEEYIEDFKAPFVKESSFKIGMRFKEAINIKLNDTTLVVGEIDQIIIPDNAMINEDVNLEAVNSVGISGLNTYYSLKKIDRFPYARVGEIPKW